MQATALRPAPANTQDTQVSQSSGGITITIPAGEMRPDVIARLFADVVAISKGDAGTRGSFEQYARALAGLNGPAEGDPAQHEAACAQVVAAGAKAFAPERFTWQAGQAPAAYAAQLRDLTIALLRRTETKIGMSSDVVPQQADNLMALARAYEKLLSVVGPRSGPVREVGRYKVPEWEGSVWKDTLVKYEQTIVDYQHFNQYQNLAAELGAASQKLRNRTLTPAEVQALISKLTDHTRMVEGINAQGLPLKVRSWAQQFD